MNEQISSPSSKTRNILSAFVISIVLLLFGFLPFGVIFYVAKGYIISIEILTLIVFLASIAVTVALIRLAMRSWNNKAKTAGIYSVTFGSSSILFNALSYFYIHQGMIADEGLMVFIFALPAFYGFPVIGLILGLIGFKSTWGKVGLLLAGQLIFMAFGIIWSNLK